jgi:hypothetical protein
MILSRCFDADRSLAIFCDDEKHGRVRGFLISGRPQSEKPAGFTPAGFDSHFTCVDGADSEIPVHPWQSQIGLRHR